MAASKSETAGIVVDVSAVTFFGAAAIGAVIRARNHEQEKSRDLLLRAPPSVVTRVLDICDLADLVEPLATAEPGSAPSTGSETRRHGPVAFDRSHR